MRLNAVYDLSTTFLNPPVLLGRTGQAMPSNDLDQFRCDGGVIFLIGRFPECSNTLRAKSFISLSLQ
jgi:hypothetical protein